MDKGSKDLVRTLRARGVSKKDAKAAVWLVKAIWDVNRMVLPTPARFEMYYGRSRFTAAYRPARDSYSIHARGLNRKLVAAARQILPRDAVSRRRRKARNPGLAIVGVATHEVRHRIQYQNRSRLFSPTRLPKADLAEPLGKKAHAEVRRRFRRNRRREFDALLIELLALHHAPQWQHEKEWADLLLSEPA